MYTPGNFLHELAQGDAVVHDNKYKASINRTIIVPVKIGLMCKSKQVTNCN